MRQEGAGFVQTGSLVYLGQCGRKMAGGQAGRVPVGCDQDFRFYSKDCGKPLIGIKQWQDLIWLHFCREWVIRVWVEAGKRGWERTEVHIGREVWVAPPCIFVYLFTTVSQCLKKMVMNRFSFIPLSHSQTKSSPRYQPWLKLSLPGVPSALPTCGVTSRSPSYSVLPLTPPCPSSQSPPQGTTSS